MQQRQQQHAERFPAALHATAVRLQRILELCGQITEGIDCADFLEHEAQAIKHEPEFLQMVKNIAILRRRKKEVSRIVSQFERAHSDISVFHRPLNMNQLGYTQYCRLVYFVETLELEIDQELLDLDHMLEDTMFPLRCCRREIDEHFGMLARQVEALEATLRI